MTETSAPRLTLCEGFPPDIAGCYLYMSADITVRAEHRRWHMHEAKVTKALRDANKELTATVRQQAGRINELEHDVHNIDIPEPIEPLTIVAAGDLEPLDDEPEEGDEYASTAAYDGDPYDEPATAPVSSAQPANDRDDDLSPYNASTRP